LLLRGGFLNGSTTTNDRNFEKGTQSAESHNSIDGKFTPNIERSAVASEKTHESRADLDATAQGIGGVISKAKRFHAVRFAFGFSVGQRSVAA